MGMQSFYWRRTVYVLFVVHLLTSAGFNLVVPFLPLYLKTLTVVTTGNATFWSGVVYAAPALSMMLSSPLWGFLADRHGRKLMLVRSTAAGAVLLALMGFVRTVEELALLRVLQGALTGNIAASNALVAATTPKEHMGASFGFLRTSTWVGMGLGPLLGGILGALVGYRRSFWVTGGLVGLGALTVIFLVREEFKPPQRSERISFFSVYRTLIFGPGLRRLYSLSFLHAVGQSMVLPIIPLFLFQLIRNHPDVSVSTGILFGLKATFGVIGSFWLGRLGDRIGHGRVVVVSSMLMVILFLPQPFVGHAWQLIALQGFVGLASVGIVPGIGALMSLYLPRGAAGATYGLDTSVTSLARTVGPMLGVTLAELVGLRWVFVVAAAIYLTVSLLAEPLFNVVSKEPGERI